MDTPDVLAAVAKRINDHKAALGLAGVSYPQDNTVPASPWVMIRQSRTLPTTYTKRSALQMVQLNIEVIVLVVSQEETPREEARLDALVDPILDLFDANATGGNINHAFPDLLEPVDRIWDAATVIRQPVNWSGQYCYAAYISLDALFRRTPQPIGGTP